MTERNNQNASSRSTHHSFHGLMVIGLVSVFGILFALTLRFNQSVSELENRRLASWPTLTSQTLLNGSYTQEIEKYIADHFPGRSWFTEAAFAIRTYRGVQTNNRVIQVKGAETGFEDVSKWANVTENSSPDEYAEQNPSVQTEEPHALNVPEAPNVPDVPNATPASIDSESVVVSTPVTIEHSPNTTPLIKDEVKETAIELVTTSGETKEIHTKIASPTPLPIDVAHTPLPSDIEVPEVTASRSTDQIAITEKSSHVEILPVAPSPLTIGPTAASPDIKTSPLSDPVAVNTAKTQVPVTKQSTPIESKQAKPLNVVGGVLLHEGQALFMFQGTDRGAQGYANAVNTWVELVANKRPGMTSTVVVTPTSSHFYLPPAARARTTSEPKNLAAMRAALLPEVHFADVVSEMEGHQDEALFFKSDHHWTGLGAYYAYRAWARVNSVAPLDLSAFDKRSVPGVAGSFWSLTQAPELRNADKESYYYVPTTVTFDGIQYAGPQQKSPMAQPFFAEKSRGYIVFLGGDIPLLVSNTSAGTGRTALVIKNSYGNAFAPYLLPHFDRVVVLDYRYVSRNIQDIVDTFGVTDLVFVNATITANSGAHQERMRQVARGSSTAWLTEAEKRRIKQQENDAAKAQTSGAASMTAQ